MKTKANDKQFMSEYDHILYFYGTVKLDEVKPNILEEYFGLTDLAEIKKFYTLKIETSYYRWGRGKDDDGEFHQLLLFESCKGKGSFLLTTIEYEQIQYSGKCIHSVRKKWNRQTNQIENVPTDEKWVYGEYWLECGLYHDYSKSADMSYHHCRLCKDFVPIKKVDGK